MSKYTDNMKSVRAYHQATFDALGIPNAELLSKCAYKSSVMKLTERHIHLFEGEIGKGVDLYIEFGDLDQKPEQIEGYVMRGLYKWKFNPHYKTEYLTSDPSLGPRYYIPIAELVLVTKPPASKLRIPADKEIKQPERESTVSEIAIKLPDESDLLTRDMTILDYAAIHLRKPISKRKWLNDLITK